MDYSPLGSSVHGISQARMLEWDAISFSRGSSWPRDWTLISCIGRQVFHYWATWEAHILCVCVCVYQMCIKHNFIYIYVCVCVCVCVCVAAAAKSLQSYPTLCDPIDGSPPGSPVPGILQARTLERVAISCTNAWKWKVKVKPLSRVQLFVTPWTAAYQAPPSMGFSRQEYWSGVPSPSPIYVCVYIYIYKTYIRERNRQSLATVRIYNRILILVVTA